MLDHANNDKLYTARVRVEWSGRGRETVTVEPVEGGCRVCIGNDWLLFSVVLLLLALSGTDASH